MKYVDEFRDRAAALAERIKQIVRRPWTIMEVCGGGRPIRSCGLGWTVCCPKTTRWFMGERGIDH
jgi:hydrogenase maturation factor